MTDKPKFDGGVEHVRYINERFRSELLDEALAESVFELLPNRQQLLSQLANEWLNNPEIRFEDEYFASMNLMQLIFVAYRGQVDPKPHKVFRGFMRHPNPRIARKAYSYQLASESNEVKDLRNLSRGMEYQRTGSLPSQYFSIDIEAPEQS
ncbi:MAG: hypothetical protein KF760_30260 [Candidatus Eremiobacteraeota bacterium]|nr:hypothetical protein [Candidatus Eremiobacteraeota bacterium]MCW5868135.1 hypothetical protein [Candidatus Eremiobacteraeota bacterium]